MGRALLDIRTDDEHAWVNMGRMTRMGDDGPTGRWMLTPLHPQRHDVGLTENTSADFRSVNSLGDFFTSSISPSAGCRAERMLSPRSATETAKSDAANDLMVVTD